MAEGRDAVSPVLRDLGWYAWANDIDRGRATLGELLPVLRQHVQSKRFWLANHTFQPNTEAEGRHAAMTSWCERAERLIRHLAASHTQQEETP